MTNNKVGRYLSESIGLFLYILRTFFLKLHGVALSTRYTCCNILRSLIAVGTLKNSSIASEVNWDPQSVNISSGTPTLPNISTNDSVIHSVSVLGSAAASGYRAAISIRASMSREILTERNSIELIMSTATRSNGASLVVIFPTHCYHTMTTQAARQP